jgi:hypothetical protein
LGIFGNYARASARGVIRLSGKIARGESFDKDDLLRFGFKAFVPKGVKKNSPKGQALKDKILER